LSACPFGACGTPVWQRAVWRTSEVPCARAEQAAWAARTRRHSAPGWCRIRVGRARTGLEHADHLLHVRLLVGHVLAGLARPDQVEAVVGEVHGERVHDAKVHVGQAARRRQLPRALHLLRRQRNACAARAAPRACHWAVRVIIWQLTSARRCLLRAAPVRCRRAAGLASAAPREAQRGVCAVRPRSRSHPRHLRRLLDCRIPSLESAVGIASKGNATPRPGSTQARCPRAALLRMLTRQHAFARTRNLLSPLGLSSLWGAVKPARAAPCTCACGKRAARCRDVPPMPQPTSSTRAGRRVPLQCSIWSTKSILARLKSFFL